MIEKEGGTLTDLDSLYQRVDIFVEHFPEDRLLTNAKNYKIYENIDRILFIEL